MARDLDVDSFGLFLRPLEADPPLIIDPDAVLASPVSSQRLESVSGRSPEIEKLRRGIEPIKRDIGAIPRESLQPSDMLAAGKQLGITVPILGRHCSTPFNDSRRALGILDVLQVTLPGVSIRGSSMNLMNPSRLYIGPGSIQPRKLEA
jgi:hypothetical protein